MKIIYEDSAKMHQCIFCRNWDNSCVGFKIFISENSDHFVDHVKKNIHPSYRTLETFKCSICDHCRKKGEDSVIREIHAYMDEYIGNEHK